MRRQSRTMPYHKGSPGYGKAAIGRVRVGRIAAGRRENFKVDVRGSQNTLNSREACSGRMGPYPVALLRPDKCVHVKANRDISAALQQAGLTIGPVFALQRHIGGNTRMAFPGVNAMVKTTIARVVLRDSPTGSSNADQSSRSIMSRTATSVTARTVVFGNCESETGGVACRGSGSMKAKPSGLKGNTVGMTCSRA